jgi:hypothetical protein
LAITKKNKPEDHQNVPVFTYLVSNIGERLTSVKREDIDDDDLPEMERLFRIFMADRVGAKDYLEKHSGRCRVVDVERFRTEDHWVIDRWWSRMELIAIGAKESIQVATKEEVSQAASAFSNALDQYEAFILGDPIKHTKNREVVLGNQSLFELSIGTRVLKNEVQTDTSLIPVYSANVYQPMGYIEEERGNLTDFSRPRILWGIDGNFEFNLIPANTKFATTDHCGAITILDSTILPEYILYALHLRRLEESFDRAFRSSLANMRKFALAIPIDGKGKLDVQAQKTAAARFTPLKEKRKAVEAGKKLLDSTTQCYLGDVSL